MSADDTGNAAAFAFYMDRWASEVLAAGGDPRDDARLDEFLRWLAERDRAVFWWCCRAAMRARLRHRLSGWWPR